MLRPLAEGSNANPVGKKRQGALRIMVKPRGLPSTSPEVLEPCRRQFGVPDGVLDVAVAEIGLQGSGLGTLPTPRRSR